MSRGLSTCARFLGPTGRRGLPPQRCRRLPPWYPHATEAGLDFKLRLRFELGPHANVCPIRLFEGVRSPLVVRWRISGKVDGRGTTPSGALVGDHLAVIGKATGRDDLDLSFQAGDFLELGGKHGVRRRVGMLGAQQHGVLLARPADHEP